MDRINKALLSGSRGSIALLIVILTIITTIVLSITITTLYQASFEAERLRLEETAQSRARFIEAVARYDRDTVGKGNIASSKEATLSQIREAHFNFKGFGETGEYILAERVDNDIVFLLRHRHEVMANHQNVPFDSTLAEPMRRALSGQSGTMVGYDLEGKKVLAAFEPVKLLNLGVVVKIDVAEVRAPFVRAGLFAIAAAMLLILIGAYLFLRIGMPLIRRVEKSEENLNLALEASGVGSWNWNIVKDTHSWDDYIHPLFGLAPGSFSGDIEQFFDLLHPEDRIPTKKSVMDAVKNGNDYNSEYRVVWPNGETHTLVARGKVYRDRKNQPIRMTGIVWDITEERAVEEALEFTQFAVDKAADMAFWMREDASFFYVNDAACQSLGYTKEELLGMKAYEVNPNHSVEGWAQHWNELRDKKTFVFEAALACKSGEVFPAEFTANYIVVNGKGYNCSFVRDISERKQSEIALQQASELTATVVKSLHVGTTIYDASGQCTLANDAMVSLVGADSKDALLLQNYNTIPTWKGSGLLATAKTAIEKNMIQRQQVDMTTTFGKYVVIDCYFIPFQVDEQSDLLFTAYDITDLRNYEQLMGEYESRLHLLSSSVEQTEESIAITDLDGTILYVNSAFSELTGYSSEEAVGRNPRVLKSGEQSDEYYRQMWSVLTTGEPWQGRTVNKRKDGSLYPSLLTISPIKDDAGVVTNYVGIQQNLSEMESLEEQLRQAQKMEALGTLVGGIAHEFNNSLAAVTGNLYLAKKEAATLPNVVSKLETVEQLSFASAELIKSLLSFARKGIVQKATLSLVSFVKETVKIQRVSLPENITLNMDIVDNDMLIEADANLLQQLLMNIMNNSRDAMQDVAQPSITVALRKFEADAKFLESHPHCDAQTYAQICIRDNGIGIKAEHLPHVFEPFHTSKVVGKGTGLGLAMAFGAVQTHKGAIEIESVEGIGTKVKVYFPIFQSEALLVKDDKNETVVVEGQGETILLVDDNASILNTGKSILESLSYKVLTAANGQEAIAVYQANQDKVALIVTDVVMPVMGGVDAVKKIRESAPDVKVIFSTGYDRSHMRKADRMDDEVIISKPFKLEELSLLLREKLSSDSSHS